jgi:3-oxoacyl-[acyl-carrier protein] reductase
MKIEGSICAVTGAGRGLGCQIAIDLARKGAKVYGCDLSDDAMTDARRKATEQQLSIETLVCDVTDEHSVGAFFEAIADREMRLDVLVNNAGITRDGLLIKVKDGQIARMSLADFRSVIDVNLVGVFLCAREAAAMMARGGGGVIINLSSISRAGNFGQTNYAAAKAGVDAMTVTWSKELARYGIRVAAIAPGYTGTEMVRAVAPAVLDRIIDDVPLKRLGQPAEISQAVQFVIENDFVHGRVLEIDGGLRI